MKYDSINFFKYSSFGKDSVLLYAGDGVLTLDTPLT